MSEFAQELTKTEQTARNQFVEEYLVDYHAKDACIRMGYADTYASSMASKFMSEPYTLKRITQREQALGLVKDEAKHKHRIVAGLYKEALSPRNSGSAKVAAYTQLAKIMGVEAPAKTEVALTTTGPDLSHLSAAELEEIKRKMYGDSTAK